MAFEKRDGTHLCTFDPPLPRRGFPITAAGSTTNSDLWGGGGEDGRQYGKFTVDTTYWSGVSGLGTPPMSPGEKFQVYTWNGGNHGFYPSGGPPVYGGAAPDLQRTEVMLGQTTPTSPNPAWTLKIPTVRTVLGAKQTAGNTWDVYFTPYLADTIDTTNDGILTLPQPMNGVWLGTIAYEQNMNYSWSAPGGPSNLTFTLTMPPEKRVTALNPGRIVQAFRGASCIWEGIMQEPQPTATGWDCSANGAGTYGDNFGALYDIWNADEPIYQAIARGLRWNNDGIGTPAGIYLQTPQDTGSMTITDFLNQLCTGGALYYSVEPPDGACVPAGPWTVRLRPFPNDLDGNPLSAGISTPEQWSVSEWQRIDLKAKLPRLPPDLYIVNVNPIPRTVANDYNSLLMKYQVTGDNTATSTVTATSATYATVIVDNPASVAQHGRVEYYLDITVAGTLTEAQVVQIGQQILQKYVRANFATAFTVQPGQLINNGGAPVDLGCNWAGKVASVQVMTQAFGGEVTYGTVSFLVGDYEYDDASQTAQLSPYQSQYTDIASIISLLYPGKFNLWALVFFRPYVAAVIEKQLLGQDSESCIQSAKCRLPGVPAPSLVASDAVLAQT